MLGAHACLWGFTAARLNSARRARTPYRSASIFKHRNGSAGNMDTTKCTKTVHGNCTQSGISSLETGCVSTVRIVGALDGAENLLRPKRRPLLNAR
ncbi:unnamed protein product [Ranitomeya imitator]|uniref:Secreted protein n=1 Tax=Ranitomeya imitator TaxID=111125 RepID=A0ABN9MAG7_9NEOB|nr:unnamed protein product [Ranitomeya imitator]